MVLGFVAVWEVEFKVLGRNLNVVLTLILILVMSLTLVLVLASALALMTLVALRWFWDLLLHERWNLRFWIGI